MTEQNVKAQFKNLVSEQIDIIVKWMNEWEQLRDTVIPIRFKECFSSKERIGIIEVDDDIYTEGYKYVKKIFEYVRPTNIKFDAIRNKWVIKCYCDIFEYTIEGDEIPKYEALITKHEKDELSVSFKRVP